jgi:hypothetical protein
MKTEVVGVVVGVAVEIPMGNTLFFHWFGLMVRRRSLGRETLSIAAWLLQMDALLSDLLPWPSGIGMNAGAHVHLRVGAQVASCIWPLPLFSSESLWPAVVSMLSTPSLGGKRKPQLSHWMFGFGGQSNS